MTENKKIKTNLKELIDTKDFVDHVSVDCVIFGFHKDSLKVLLLKYHDLDLWSVPGGFIINDPNVNDAAARTLYERTHLSDVFLEQFYTFGDIKRTENNVHQKLLENKNIEVVGFGQSPIFKMANKFRYEILLRSKNIKALLNALHGIQSPNASIDMDTIY